MQSYRLDIWKKLAQQSALPTTQISANDLSAMPAKDVKLLPNVKTYLFDMPDWMWINKIINGTSGLKGPDGLNAALWILSNGKVSFLYLSVNQSISGSQYTNSLKNLVNFSNFFYKSLILDRKGTPYTKQEVKNLIKTLLNMLLSNSFPDKIGLSFKEKIYKNLQNWLNSINP